MELPTTLKELLDLGEEVNKRGYKDVSRFLEELKGLRLGVL
jgi:hypothetical protein